MNHGMIEEWRRTQGGGELDYLKVSVGVVVAALILIGLAHCRFDAGFVETTPVLLVQTGGDFHFKRSPEIATPAFWKNFGRVLKWYHRSYRSDSEGRVLIVRELASDEELLANLCAKALDQTFLSQLPEAPDANGGSSERTAQERLP